MTGYTVHTGATEKFVEGWDKIFKQPSRSKRPTAKKRATKTASKKKPKS